MSALWSLVRSAGCALTALLAVNGSYAPVRWALRRVHGKAYDDLTPERRAYVTKNAVKSAVLFACSPVALLILYERLSSPVYSNVGMIRLAGQIYSACDIVGSVRLAGRMPSSTKMHHAMVAGFSVVNLTLDYNDWSNPFSNLAVVAATSCLSYSVNYYLSLRKVVEHRDSRLPAVVGTATYLPTFLFGLAFHACTVDPTTWRGALFTTLLLPIWYDDAVLLRHLARRVLGE